MKGLSERLNVIFSHLKSAEVFADVGCDHGYIAKAMLDGEKCDRAIVTDISAECLEKAKELLNGYDNVTAIVADGLKGVPQADEVLIAGMGGELICKIIENADFLPERFVLQPMKNSDKVRRVLIKSGYKLINDYTFKSDGKFYDLICAKKGMDFYTEKEYIYGRDNLKERNAAFLENIMRKRNKLIAALKNTDGENAKILETIKEYDGILD